MQYHFRVGRGKNIIISDTKTFEDLGLAILRGNNIIPYHLFVFVFSNGDETNSASPLGYMDDYRDVQIDSKLKSRMLEVYFQRLPLWW